MTLKSNNSYAAGNKSIFTLFSLKSLGCMYGVFFCQAPSTMFTASLCYARLYIPSSTALTYSWFIDLGVVYLHKKEAEKIKTVHVRLRDIKRIETSSLNVRAMRETCIKNWTLQLNTEESSTKTTQCLKKGKLFWKSPYVGKVRERKYLCAVLQRKTWHDSLCRFLQR